MNSRRLILFLLTMELMLHQTWAYRRDDPRFSVKSPKPGEPATQEEMYRGLSSA